MNLGILVLRALLGSILVAHSFQKSRAWFGGQGPDRMATVFEGPRATCGLRGRLEDPRLMALCLRVLERQVARVRRQGPPL